MPQNRIDFIFEWFYRTFRNKVYELLLLNCSVKLIKFLNWNIKYNDVFKDYYDCCTAFPGQFLKHTWNNVLKLFKTPPSSRFMVHSQSDNVHFNTAFIHDLYSKGDQSVTGLSLRYGASRTCLQSLINLHRIKSPHWPMTFAAHRKRRLTW